MALYNRLGEVLGPQHAETLMASLPFQPASELATRSDIDRLEARINDLESEMRSEFRTIRATISDHQRTYVAITIGAMTALTGIFGLIVGLIT